MMPTPPSLSLAAAEIPRATWDACLVAPRMGALIRHFRGSGDGHPILVLPGYGAADGSTRLLRYFLKRIGYQTFGLDAGRNVEGLENRIQSVDDASRFRERLTEITGQRLIDINEMTGQSVSLIGWSMGGLYAFDASQQHSDIARQVITLGTPFGDPRGTSLFNVMRRLSGSTVPIEKQDFNGWLKKACEPRVPTCVIYSESDGIVGSDIAKLPNSPLLQTIPVVSSHLGFTINGRVLEAIATTLIEHSVRG